VIGHCEPPLTKPSATWIGRLNATNRKKLKKKKEKAQGNNSRKEASSGIRPNFDRKGGLFSKTAPPAPQLPFADREATITCDQRERGDAAEGKENGLEKTRQKPKTPQTRSREGGAYTSHNPLSERSFLARASEMLLMTETDGEGKNPEGEERKDIQACEFDVKGEQFGVKRNLRNEGSSRS